MPPSSQRRWTTRRSPRPAPRPAVAPVTPVRPMLVPFAVVFGLLVAAVDGFLAKLLDFGWYLAVPVVLGVGAVAGAALVWWGRRLGWAVLALAAALLLLGLLGLVVLFGLLGGGAALWAALLMLVAPVGCLAVVLRRPVRRWCDLRGRTRSPGGGRARASSG